MLKGILNKGFVKYSLLLVILILCAASIALYAKPTSGKVSDTGLAAGTGEKNGGSVEIMDFYEIGNNVQQTTQPEQTQQNNDDEGSSDSDSNESKTFIPSGFGGGGSVQCTPTHHECQNEQCVVVSGAGPDECTTDADCIPLCGNGVIDVEEECDEGQQNGIPCTPPYGGNCTYCNSSCELITLTDGYCGDEVIQQGYEQCELPNTQNNVYCLQNISECSGYKLGSRDAYGNCSSECGCNYDSFVYNCVKDQCDAECANNSDCDDQNASTVDTCDAEICSCEHEFNPYCGDGNVTSGEQCELPNTYNNTYCIQNTSQCQPSGRKLGTRDAYGNCDGSCGCTYDPFVYNCVKDVCGAECDLNSGCPDYCEGSVKHTGRTCGWCSTCLCTNGTAFNCNSLDVWYNTTETKWISTGECTEKEQKKQEYRDYVCKVSPAVDCYYNVTQTNWVDTGQTRNKPDGTGCNDGLWCTDNDVCTAGSCGGSDKDCSDEVECTDDSCDETHDMCVNTPDDSECNDGLWCNGGEICDAQLGCVDGTQVNCSDYDIPEIAICDNVPDANPYTWDYGAGFVSECDEDSDRCTQGDQNLTHTCSVANCEAECDSNDDCECQQDGCIGKDWYDYPQEGICLESCVCDEGACTPSISYNDPRCSHKVCDYQLQACVVVNGTGSNECATWEDCGGYCGNENVEPPEQCELPNTSNNSYCIQNTSQCQPSGRKLGTRDAYGNCDGSCGCTYDPFVYKCIKDVCGAECDLDSGCPDYCEGSVKHTGRTCGWCSTCLCSNGTTFNCDSLDGWYDTGDKRWVSTGECSEKEQKKQEYRDYVCKVSPAVDCYYNVTQTNWVDTGQTRNKPDGTGCNDGLWCTDNDVCTAGSCGGTNKSCSDDISCTDDSCDEVNDECINTPDNTKCDDDLYCNGNEVCDTQLGCVGGTAINCSGYNIKKIATCDNNPDNIHYTWDYGAPFISVCDETHDVCTNGTQTLTHTCSVLNCSAQCDATHGCANSTCSQTYNDYCNTTKLVEYDSDKVKDSTTVNGSCQNSCRSNCTCTNCTANCSPPPTNTYCVKGVCNASCAVNSDCTCQLDGCMGKDYYDYPSQGACTNGCTCNQSACTPAISYNDPRCSHKVCDYQLQACSLVEGAGTNQCSTWQDCQFCGNGRVDPPEQCELPSTVNNAYCIQTTSQCSGTKLGTRDALGNCGASCGCVYDPFTYACAKGQCGATCAVNGDCSASNCSQTYNDYCTGNKLTEYDSDKVKDSTTVTNSTSNTCQGSCLCTNNAVTCNPPSTNMYCVKSVCSAACAVNSDCDDGNVHTTDTCDVSNCICKHELIPYCGDGNVNAGEQCELPSTVNNAYCIQTTSQCSGTKLGTRDALGNCGASCGCVYDPFTYSCVKGQCGAACAVNSDCACQQDGCVGIDYYDYPDYTTCDGNCACGECNPVITECDPRCMGACKVEVYIAHDMNPNWGYPYTATDDIYLVAEDVSNGACNGLDIPITYWWCDCPQQQPEQIAIETMPQEWSAKYDRLCSADAAYYNGQNPTHSLECSNCHVRRYNAEFPAANGKKFWTNAGACQGTFQVDIPQNDDCYIRLCTEGKVYALACAGQCEDHPEHYECQNMACVKVSGYGKDECNSNDDCYYSACDYNQNACVKKAGTQTDQCSTWSDCIHKVCNYQTLTCDVVESPGTSECSSFSDCSEYHYACTDVYTCERVPGPGISGCLKPLDCNDFDPIQPLDPQPAV